jgi:hypothetical protein
MSRKRNPEQRARDRERAEEQLRDLVIVAAAVEGFDHAHPALLAESEPSDSPLVTEPIRSRVLTHDESGDSDE